MLWDLALDNIARQVPSVFLEKNF